eukprot:CAMPEP_0182863802 /NCGR_PEP_ID=MMETSP0034_2-20130328/6842_1 /TAXON_ID=156128 /ORGANISM="Nephroselmis pyriformis, Strain CCMP717" /LENGTH=83 /DNA_ID=CAMNT_0024996041 /DNA_START=178 /DNA_END=425 /DNA_ORIENTATION=-
MRSVGGRDTAPRTPPHSALPPPFSSSQLNRLLHRANATGVAGRVAPEAVRAVREVVLVAARAHPVARLEIPLSTATTATTATA